jgi:hypothetical protein
MTRSNTRINWYTVPQNRIRVLGKRSLVASSQCSTPRTPLHSAVVPLPPPPDPLKNSASIASTPECFPRKKSLLTKAEKAPWCIRLSVCASCG